uniref:TYRO protein tyrosine kinase-binding protein n=1 Tax=Hippocampus comes TaxID=109280 RepID=A0A3Q3DEM8_HIPCM
MRRTFSFAPTHHVLWVVYSPDSPVSCYRIEPGVLAGIISADVLLTLIIVTITYRYAINRSRKNHKHREKSKAIPRVCVCVCVRACVRELHGIQSDVYSELQHFRK